MADIAGNNIIAPIRYKIPKWRSSARYKLPSREDCDKRSIPFMALLDNGFNAFEEFV